MRRCTSGGSSTTRPGAKGCDSSSDEEMMYHSMTERPPRRRQPSSCGSHCLQAGRTVLPLLFLVALACSTLAYFAGAAYIRSHAAAAIVIDTNSDGTTTANAGATLLTVESDGRIQLSHRHITHAGSRAPATISALRAIAHPATSVTISNTLPSIACDVAMASMTSSVSRSL